MRTDAELDRLEDEIGVQKPQPYVVVKDEQMERAREQMLRLRLAMPRVANMAKCGVRSQGGLEWLRRFFSPETWRDREFSRRIAIGKTDQQTSEALAEALQILRINLGVTEMLIIVDRNSRRMRDAEALERWWVGLDKQSRRVGMDALKRFHPDLEGFWDKADLDQKIDLLAKAMWAIEEHRKTLEAQALVESVATPAAPRPQPDSHHVA